MDIKMNIFFHVTHIALLIVANVAWGQECGITDTIPNMMVDVNLPNGPHVIKKLTDVNRHQCTKACCDALESDNCVLTLFNTENGECFLVDCEDCSIVESPVYELTYIGYTESKSTTESTNAVNTDINSKSTTTVTTTTDSVGTSTSSTTTGVTVKEKDKTTSSVSTVTTTDTPDSMLATEAPRVAVTTTGQDSVSSNARNDSEQEITKDKQDTPVPTLVTTTVVKDRAQSSVNPVTYPSSTQTPGSTTTWKLPPSTNFGSKNTSESLATPASSLESYTQTTTATQWSSTSTPLPVETSPTNHIQNETANTSLPTNNQQNETQIHGTSVGNNTSNETQVNGNTLGNDAHENIVNTSTDRAKQTTGSTTSSTQTSTDTFWPWKTTSTTNRPTGSTTWSSFYSWITSTFEQTTTTMSYNEYKTGTTSSTDAEDNMFGGHDTHSGSKMKGPAQMSAGLIVMLSIGIFLTFVLMVVLGKRLFDGWQRRHYNKLDYLINGMYN